MIILLAKLSLFAAVTMYWHFYDDELFDPATRENKHE
jgi:hypothetical protein